MNIDIYPGNGFMAVRTTPDELRGIADRMEQERAVEVQQDQRGNIPVRFMLPEVNANEG